VLSGAGAAGACCVVPGSAALGRSFGTGGNAAVAALVPASPRGNAAAGVLAGGHASG